MSPNFIASDYCFETEMQQALARNEAGHAVVIPVILRPCSWHSLPFGKLLAAPKDGRAVTLWPNKDSAFLDITEMIKSAAEQFNKVIPKIFGLATPSLSSTTQTTMRSSNLRIKKNFTQLDKDRFRTEGFDYIANFFEGSLQELQARNEGVQGVLRRIDADHFTAAAYLHGTKVCKATISLSETFGADAIEYSDSDDGRNRGISEIVHTQWDEQALYFESSGMRSYGPNKPSKLTYEGVSEMFWAIFLKPLQQ